MQSTLLTDSAVADRHDSSSTRRTSRGPAVPAGHRSDIQGLRGLAVVMVVAYHAEVLFTGGFVGVDVFFVISGFVITMSLIRELERHNRIDFTAFYTRRVKRLLPALAVTLVATAGISALALSPFGPQSTAATTGLAASSFASNVFLYFSPSGYFDAPAAVNPFLHMWSLSVEEQFYFAYPILLAGSWAVISRLATFRFRERTALAAALGAMAAGSLLVCVWLTNAAGPVAGIAEPARLAFYAPFTRGWEFIAGGLLALAAPRLAEAHHRLGDLCGLVGVALLALVAFRYTELTRFPGMAAILPVGAAVLLIASGTISSRGVLRAWLGQSWLVRLGDISYGWYLWHWPLIVAARMIWPENRLALVGAAVFSLAPAVASYRLVENRIRFSRALTGRRVAGLAAVCIVLPLLVMGGLRAGSKAGWASDRVSTSQLELGIHIDELRGCNSTASFDDPACRWDPAGISIGTIALVGDSNAGHFTEGVIAAANELNYSVIVSTYSACPFADVEFSRPGAGFDGWCAVHAGEIVDRLAEIAPDAVVVASASDRYLEEIDGLRRPGAAATATDAIAQAEMWRAGLATTIADIAAGGSRVLVVHPAPRFEGFDPFTRCTTLSAVLDVSGCGVSAMRRDIDASRAAALGAEQAAVASVGSAAQSFDPVDSLCTVDPCQTLQGGVWMFRDEAHLSIPGAESLNDEFRAAFGALLAT